MRYSHFGEGAYAEQEKQIQVLLTEAREGRDGSLPEEDVER
ncbi:hypothetical protein [Pseudomonas batumici]|uniref:Uncharacterized protein n=1 Tax=Pseudomonas batumici TaxID=226910 RepID=A0A0C2ICF7_9PSED|nr:hypothetical protein [Pseudomonas batumici]KIH82652.1 hypothetical protein UCMB321_3650 [Pseudomonas batumici]